MFGFSGDIVEIDTSFSTFLRRFFRIIPPLTTTLLLFPVTLVDSAGVMDVVEAIEFCCGHGVHCASF